MERRPSRTALGAAVLRAVHQLIDDEPRVLDDPIVLQLLRTSILEQIRLNPNRFRTSRMRGLRSHIVLRSRYAEDLLAEAVGNGVRQYLMLGAGLDSFPYRQPHWATTLRIFEVDHVASQRSKRERLTLAGIETPSNVEFVSLDFETTSLRERLGNSGFDFGKPAFFSWLGVMMYLRTSTVDVVFRFVASLPRSSEIIFDFASPTSEVKETSTEPSHSTAALAAAQGEPWLTRFEPNDLVSKLQGLGFSRASFLSATDADARYFRDRRDGLHGPKRAHIANAIL